MEPALPSPCASVADVILLDTEFHQRTSLAGGGHSAALPPPTPIIRLGSSHSAFNQPLGQFGVGLRYGAVARGNRRSAVSGEPHIYIQRDFP